MQRNHHGRPVLTGSGLLARVRPDVRGSARNARLGLVVCTIGAGVCFVLFAIGGFAMVGSDTFGFSTTAIVAFVGFGFFGMLSSAYGTQVYKMNALVALLNEIQGRDRIRVEALTLSVKVGQASALMIVQRLMETGNLPDHEIIADVGIARRDLGLTPQDFGIGGQTIIQNTIVERVVEVPVQVSVQSASRPTRCTGCGGAITEDSGNFCRFCGGKL